MIGTLVGQALSGIHAHKWYNPTNDTNTGIVHVYYPTSKSSLDVKQVADFKTRKSTLWGTAGKQAYPPRNWDTAICNLK